MGAKWIWYRSDYEIYHNMLLHCRRVDRNADYPSMWHICRPECTVRFHTKVEAKKSSVIKIISYGRGMAEFTMKDGSLRFPINKEFALPAGKYDLCVQIYDIEHFPAIYINSDYVWTDENWHAERCDRKPLPVDYEPVYERETDNPFVFPFVYQDISPVQEEELKGGLLLDYGKEMFGPVTFNTRVLEDEIFYSFGESREEALDFDHSVISNTLKVCEGTATVTSSAFRYIFVRADGGNVGIHARYEYLPLQDVAIFRCNEERINKIWDMCSYTLHLNSREFLLDGIKRDRWVWAGDAYQSFMVSSYLYHDDAIIRRTIKALLGRPPILQHLNTINDYSALLIIGIWEYYFSSGDRAFLSSIWEYVKELYHFIEGRLVNGYVVEQPGDWIFIDWAEFDKDGPLCAEQILLWQVYRCMAKLSEVNEECGKLFEERANELKAMIIKDFYDERHCAFIDSNMSGNRHITRHANIFAILYHFVSGERAKEIATHVIYNDDVPQITTPYFKFFELTAMASLGYIEDVQNYIESYWGGMEALGATTVWEEYDPMKCGVEHYAMYGKKFAKSLCHAWGSGPIYLLGRYVMGVYPTAVGAKQFCVAPVFGKYTQVHAIVPIGKGTVSIDYEDRTLRVSSSIAGGTLQYKGESYELMPGIEIVVN